MAFVASARTNWSVLATRRLGLQRPLEALALATADRVRLELRSDSEQASFCVELCVRGRAAILLDNLPSRASAPATWILTRGVFHQGRDVFHQARVWARGRMVPASIGRTRDRAAADAMRELDELLCMVAHAAVDRCNDAARRLALRFPPQLRFRAYARIVADPTGRIAQLVSSCPGALIFALALDEHSQPLACDAPGDSLLDDVVAGRRLASAIDCAVEGWLASFRQIEGAIWCMTLDPSERACVPARQRLLIRRAATQTAATCLWLPPPLALVPDDIPRAVRANASWFRVMKANALTIARIDSVTPRQQDELSRFLSRHAAHFARMPRASLRGCIRDLLDHARATGRWPSRQSNPSRVVDECGRWHRAIARGDLLAVPGMSARSDIRLPAPDFDPAAIPLTGITFTAIATACELVAEGREMKNCVATRLPDILAGNVVVFRGTVSGERVTLELVRVRGAWTVGDFRCEGNRVPGAEVTRGIRMWTTLALMDQDVANRAREAREGPGPEGFPF